MVSYGDREAKTGRLVLVRHGESENNKRDISTGWLDSKLTPHGRTQASDAGRLLRDMRFKPDVAFSSDLSRAVDTGELILRELGSTNVRLIQSPELRERHYGGMTGKNKRDSQAELGEDNFNNIRRGLNTVPPEMDVSNKYHPDNHNSPSNEEERRIRSFGRPPNGRVTESLQDVVDRVRPFWEKEILPRLQNGENVLIAAHGNSLRALTIILNNITDEKEIIDCEMKNGRPVIYDVTSKRGSNTWSVSEVSRASQKSMSM